MWFVRIRDRLRRRILRGTDLLSRLRRPIVWARWLRRLVRNLRCIVLDLRHDERAVRVDMHAELWTSNMWLRRMRWILRNVPVRDAM